MNLFLNTTGSAAGGVDIPTRESPMRDTPEGTLPESPFSRLLAGKVAGSRETQGEIDSHSARCETRGDHANPDSEPDVGSRAKPPADGTSSQATGIDGTIAATFESWVGLANLFQIMEPTVPGNGTIPDSFLSGGVPAGFQSRLAEDIAANFSERNGVQTITLKLEADHLGQVDVRLQAKGGHLAVRLLADTLESEAALRGNIKELSEAIQKRVGRFQHVEVRVELKGSEESGHEFEDDDSRHSPDRDPRGDSRQDPEAESGQENPITTEMETEPENRVQGG